MVSRDGFVKILDFGLAKLAASCADELSQTATRDRFQTRSGQILGTIGYMSPEQASGQQLDFRSDQFSFGLVVYEMATGKRALQGSTAAATLLAILQEEPEPMGALNPEAPAPLCWAVERCLVKQPEKRYVATRDLAQDLAAIRERFSDLVELPLEERMHVLRNLLERVPGRRRAGVELP